MKVTYELKLGDRSFFLEDDVISMKDFFQKFAPYQALEVETSGMTGVYLSHRVTSGGDDYYALVRPEEGLELHFGVVKDNSGRMFPGKYNKAEKRTDKRWVKIQHGNMADPGETKTGQEPVPIATNGANSPPPLQASKTNQEEQLTAQCRELMDSLGIENVGQEKKLVLDMLKLRVGRQLKDLTLEEKFTLYNALFAAFKQRQAA